MLLLPGTFAAAEERSGGSPFPGCPPGALIVEEHAVDLDGDGNAERVVAVRARNGVAWTPSENALPPDLARLGDGAIAVRAGTDGGWSLFAPGEYAPHLLRFADLDGDGVLEVIAGVLDRGEPMPGRGRPVRQQLHVFRWSPDGLVPFWFCGRRFLDVQPVRLGGRIRLLELTRARSVTTLRAFHWERFGWWQDAVVDLGETPVRMIREDDRVLLERADGRRVEVGWDDERENLGFSKR